MDIVAYTKKFHKMESHEGFFNLKDKNGNYYWDIIRYDIFLILYRVYILKTQKVFEYDNIMFTSKFKYLCLITLRWFNFFKLWLLIKFKKPKFLFFGCSRHMTDGHYEDQICGDLYNFVKSKAVFIETYSPAEVPVFSSKILLYRLIYKIRNGDFKKNNLNNNYTIIYNQIYSYFGIEFEIDEILNKILYKYNKDQVFYNQLLLMLKPEAIFMVQNGIQKGLFTVGNNLNIKIIELQHGIVDYTHPAYSYPPNIPMHYMVPHSFLTFSEFWHKKINYPVKEMISIGNRYYNINRNNKYDQNSILVISGAPYQNEISLLVKQLADSCLKLKLTLKLHPAQVGMLQKVKQDFTEYKNVSVVCNESSIPQLLMQNKFVLGIKSTIFYQVVQAGNYLLILKKYDYMAHMDIFDFSNVYQINSAPDIINTVTNINNIQDLETELLSPIFFEPLNYLKVKQII